MFYDSGAGYNFQLPSLTHESVYICAKSTWPSRLENVLGIMDFFLHWGLN